jgi:hypothetical protein
VRIPLVWWWRLVLGGFAISYLASETLQLLVPPILPFLAAAAVEAQFFVAGLRRAPARTVPPDRGPQERDLAEFGWASRTVELRSGDGVLVLRPGELGEREIVEWLEAHAAELAALGPGRHELAPITAPESPVRLYERPPAARPRPSGLRRRLLPAVAVVALLAGLLLLDRSRATWQKLPAAERATTLAVLGREATRIAGHQAHVICDVSGHHVGYVQDADGLAEVGGSRLWLTPDICYRLAKLPRLTPSTETSSGRAIAVLAHEAWHLRGEANEGIANCYAYQSGVRVGQALGLSAGTSRRLMRQQLATNPDEFADTPAYVVPHDCHRGGSLDLGLDATHFP